MEIDIYELANELREISIDAKNVAKRINEIWRKFSLEGTVNEVNHLICDTCEEENLCHMMQRRNLKE